MDYRFCVAKYCVQSWEILSGKYFTLSVDIGSADSAYKVHPASIDVLFL